VSHVVLLDAGPLGLITNPKYSPQSVACTKWLASLLEKGGRVVVPEIADYEVRRELLRANKAQGIERLDELARSLEFLPITTPAMRQAASFWALARQRGEPTADDRTIDGDIILAGQAATLGEPHAVIATTNVGHLARFVPAQLWQDVLP
jgi:predicted nucleic acid-binding protein